MMLCVMKTSRAPFVLGVKMSEMIWRNIKVRYRVVERSPPCGEATFVRGFDGTCACVFWWRRTFERERTGSAGKLRGLPRLSGGKRFGEAPVPVV